MGQHSGSRIVLVEDQLLTLNPTPHVSTFIPPILSYNGNGNDAFIDHGTNSNVDNGNNANVDTKDTFTHHESSSSNTFVKRKTKWFQNYLVKEINF